LSLSVELWSPCIRKIFPDFNLFHFILSHPISQSINRDYQLALVIIFLFMAILSIFPVFLVDFPGSFNVPCHQILRKSDRSVSLETQDISCSPLRGRCFHYGPTPCFEPNDIEENPVTKDWHRAALRKCCGQVFSVISKNRDIT
jgi:hypothetical protein